MCGLGCLIFPSENVNSCVWGYESLSSQNVKMSKMSPVKLGLYVQCEGLLAALWLLQLLREGLKINFQLPPLWKMLVGK